MPLVSPIDIAVLSSPVPLPGESGTVSPGSFGIDTRQNFSAMTQGSGVTSPIGTGNVTTPLPTSDPSLPRASTIEGAALTSSGSNVGGLVRTEQEVIPTNIQFATQGDEETAAVEEAFQEQKSEYQKAYEEGDTSQQTQDGKSGKTDVERVGDAVIEGATDKIKAYDTALEEGRFGDEYKDVKEGVKKAADKLGVTDALDEFKAFRKKKKKERESGMSGARRVKRADRRADRKARKDAGLKGREKRAMRKAQRQQRRDAFKEFKDEIDLQAQIDAGGL